MAPIQVVGSGATVNDATQNAFDRATALLDMSEGEVRARCTFTGGVQIGVAHRDRTDVVDPVHFWPCGSGGFPPSGLTIYDGSASAWSGDLFAGNLAGGYLGRFAVDGREVTEVERLLEGRRWRIRAVTVGLDDGLLVAVDADPGPLVRLTPA